MASVLLINKMKNNLELALSCSIANTKPYACWSNYTKHNLAMKASLFQLILPVALNVSPECEDHLLAVLPGAEILSIYGTNETGMHTVGNTCKHWGELRANVEMKVKINLKVRENSCK